MLERGALGRLFEALGARGYTVVGPTVKDGAIVFEEIASAADLPAGWSDEQEAGRYRLQKNGGPRVFDWTVGPNSLKKFLYPGTVTLWRAKRSGTTTQEYLPGDIAPRRLAVIGARACDLAALAVLDRVLLEGPHVDPVYRARREGLFLVAVNCTRPGRTCFCASMGTGPAVRTGHDLALTEVEEGGRHGFVVEAGSERGAELLEALPDDPVPPGVAEAAGEALARAARGMGRALDTEGLHDVLLKAHDHPRWDEVAARCLACTNCTLVCPTCFCVTVTDTSDLAGTGAERTRRWDSCFSLDYSYIHGGSVRTSGRARYRQWLTHKLGTWHDQFGQSGCVGCGRCITWCPAGIDLTEEARALRERKRRKEERRANA
jgi:ferredoxin